MSRSDSGSLIKFIIFSGLYILSSLASGDTLTSIEKNIPKQPFIFGTFNQTKNVEGFSIPLTSKGIFQYGKNVGLAWITQTPIFQASTYTPTEIFKWDNSGNIIHSETINPIETKIIEIVSAILSGNTSPLKSQFTISQIEDGKTWQAKLVPIDVTTAKILDHIVLTGENYIKEVFVVTNNGDETHYQFDDIEYSEEANIMGCRYLKVPNTDIHCNN